MESQFFKTPDGASLRYKYFALPNGVGSDNHVGDVVLLPGRATCIEHYLETVDKFHAINYGVWVIDLRGHGGSSSMMPSDGDKQKRKRMHINDFNQYTNDLQVWMEQVVLPTNPKSLVLFGISFGGYCATLFTLQTKIKFDAMILGVPMIRPKVILPIWAMRAWISMIYAIPFLRTVYVPGFADFDPHAESFLQEHVNDDPARFLRYQKVFVDLPDCSSNGVTIGWGKAFLNSVWEFEKNVNKNKIDIPTLVIKAGKDTVVENKQIDQCLLPILFNKQVLTLPNAEHNLILQPEPIWNSMWDAIYKFLSSALVN